MDPLDSFLEEGGHFEFIRLMNCHGVLCSRYHSEGCIFADDVKESLSFTGQTLGDVELIAYAAVIVESWTTPSLNMEGLLVLRLSADAMKHESYAVRSLVSTLHAKTSRYPSESAVATQSETFYWEAQNYLSSKYPNHGGIDLLAGGGGSRQNSSNISSAYSSNNSSNHSTPHHLHHQQQQQMQMQMHPGGIGRGGMGMTSSVSPRYALMGSANNAISSNGSSYRGGPSPIIGSGGMNMKPSGAMIGMPPPPPQQPINYMEKAEPIIKLLAQVRKVGMDILFPQVTHDKILACIFAAIRSSTIPAHRELIDMVMAVKETGKISKLEHVSKTKVRGVLALLKQGEMLITHGAEGEPVRLYISSSINSFKDLREKHDFFLNKYMAEQYIFVPTGLRNELVWTCSEEIKQKTRWKV